jgi:hypothetical protein
LILVAAGTIAMSVVATLAWVDATEPNEEEVNDAASSLAVVPEAFDDPRSVSLTLDRTQSEPIRASAAGIITSFDCTTGGSWTSGTAPLAIDGTPRLLLYTEVPLWRDLFGGERGADVDALQRSLSSLGFATDTTGVFDFATREALSDLYASVGVERLGQLNRELVMWAPSPEIGIASCTAGLGLTVPQGAPVLERPPILTVVRLSSVPEGLVPGGRIVQFGTVTAPVTDDGQILDPTVLDKIRSDPAVTATAASAEPIPLGATYRLAEPIEVVAVPPSSLTNIAGSAACITSGGESFTVEILASLLGSTLVRPTGADLPEEVDVPGNAQVPCG